MIVRIHHVCLALAASVCLLPAAARAAEPSVADLVAAAKSGEEPARLKAIDALGAQGEKAAEAVAPLTELLKDGSAKVRAHAVWALGAIGGPAKDSVPQLIELAKDPDQAVRTQVVKAVLAIHPGPKVTIPLLVKLLEDGDPGVKARVLTSIAEAGPRAVPGLKEALKNEKAAYWACIVIRDIGPEAKDTAPELAEVLKSPRPEVRREAILALASLGDAAKVAVPQIAAGLKDASTAPSATFALGVIGQIPADAEDTVKANTKSDDKMLSTASLWALARVHPDQKQYIADAMEQLVERLDDKSPYVREAAARGLASLPPAPDVAAPILEKALGGADETKVRHLLDALASAGPLVVPKLVTAIKNGKWPADAAYVLGQIGPAAAAGTEALAGLVADKDERVAQEAALALAKIGPAAKAAVPALTAALQKEGAANTHALVFALGCIGPDAAPAEPALSKLVGGNDPDLAVVAAWALTQIQPGSAEMAKKVVPVLVAGLSIPLPESRQSAARALGDLGPLAKEAVPSLETALKDKDPAVARAAEAALAAVHAPAAAKPAQELKPGDFAVTLGDDVPVQLAKEVVTKLPKGTKVKVLSLRGTWIGVRAEVGGQTITGWVQKGQLGSP